MLRSARGGKWSGVAYLQEPTGDVDGIAMLVLGVADDDRAVFDE